MINKLLNYYHQNKDKILKIGKTSISIFLFMHLFLYIFIFSRCLLNSDSTYALNYALEIIKQKSLLLEDWKVRFDFIPFSYVLALIPFIKIGLSYILSRQIIVFIQTVLLIILVRDLYKNVLKDKIGLIIISLLFLTGISGQVMFELFGDGAYGNIIFFILLEFYLFLKYLDNKKDSTCILFSVILFIISSFLNRFLIYIALPIICCLIYLIYVKNDRKKYIVFLIAIILSSLIGYLGHNILINTILAENFDNFHLVNNIKDLGYSVKSMIFNYASFIGCTNQNVLTVDFEIKNSVVTNDSLLILFIFVKFIYGIITLLLPFILYKKFNKFTEQEKLLYIFTCSQTFILFFYLYIANMYGWQRFLTPLIISLNMLYPLLYKYSFSDILKNKVVFSLGMIAICISSLFVVFLSYYDLENKNFRENQFKSVTDFLIQNDLKYGFTFENAPNEIYSIVSFGKVEVTTLSRDSSAETWINTLKWNKGTPNDRIFFIRDEEDDSIYIEGEAIDILEYKNYVIYVFYYPN